MPEGLERAVADEATMLTSVHRPEISRITDWLVEQGLLRTSFEHLVEGYCERLVALGVPIWRGYVSAQTLHPRFRGMGCSWRADQGISTDVYIHQLTPAEGYLSSPFKRMVDLGVNDLRVRLDVNEPIEFPLLEEFRQGGATDYLAQRTWFGLNGTLDDKKTGLISSWTTKAPGGFTERDLAALRHLMPRLALALQARLGHDIAVNLLDTYVGPEAGRRILNGEIRRGMLEVIKAVIFYADLRGFTANADRLARDVVVEMLNAYFDCLVPNVDAFGGQVLKFLGDGLLATFPLNGRPAAEVCELALDAAAKTLGEVRALSAERARGRAADHGPRSGPASGRRLLRQRRQHRPARLHGHRAGGQRGRADRGAVRPARPQPTDLGSVRARRQPAPPTAWSRSAATRSAASAAPSRSTPSTGCEGERLRARQLPPTLAA